MTGTFESIETIKKLWTNYPAFLLKCTIKKLKKYNKRIKETNLVDRNK